jgi:hypothetical protein
MVVVSRPVLPLLGGILAVAATLVLSACGDKAGEPPPAVPSAPTAAAPAAAAPTEPASAAADQHFPGHDREAMERHHRQQMDHEAMRQGGANADSAADPDAGSMNTTAPMKDM